jgi:hypothetical protein
MQIRAESAMPKARLSLTPHPQHSRLMMHSSFYLLTFAAGNTKYVRSTMQLHESSSCIIMQADKMLA